MCRHTVGLNWTAIGIEHVGTSDAQVLATPAAARVAAADALAAVAGSASRRKNVIGHNEWLSSPYHHERVARCARQTHGDWVHRDADLPLEA